MVDTTAVLIREALDAAEMSPRDLRRASPRSHVARKARAIVAAALDAAGFTHNQIGEAIGLRSREAVRFAIARGRNVNRQGAPEKSAT